VDGGVPAGRLLDRRFLLRKKLQSSKREVTGRDFGGQRFRSTPEFRVGGGRSRGANRVRDHARTERKVGPRQTCDQPG
jgi:hypothetical protein